MKFASKITLSVAVVSLVAVPLLVLGVFYSAKMVLQKNITKNYQAIAQQQMQTIDHLLYIAYRDIKMLAEDDFLQDLLAPREAAEQKSISLIRSKLEERALFSGPWDNLTVIDNQGTILLSTDTGSIGKAIELYPASSAAYYQASRGKTFYSDLLQPSNASRPTVLFAAPIRSGQGKNDINGVVIGHFAWPVVLQELAEIPPPAVAYLINNEEQVIAGQESITGNSVKLKPAQSVLVKRSRVSGVGGNAIFDTGPHQASEPILAVYALQTGMFGYKGSNWGLLLEIPLEKALAPVQRMAKNVAAVAMFVTIFLAGGLYYAGRMLARPIERLTKTVEEVARGDLTVKAEVMTKDEVGELATAFNRMTSKLQKTTVSSDYVDNILKTMLSTLIVLNPDATIVSVNQSALNLLGYQEKDLLGQPISLVLGEQAIFRGSRLGVFIRKGTIANAEISYISKGGRKIPVLFSGSVMRDAQENILGIVCAATDISQRKLHEEKLYRTSRALRAINANSTLIMQSDDEQKLFAGVCRNIVEQTGYQFAWIGLSQPDSAAVLIPAAYAGEGHSYIDSLLRGESLEQLTGCPEAATLSSCLPYIEMNIKSESENMHWRKEACKRGFESVIVFPLMREKQAFAVLAIYSSQDNIFAADEITLLERLADELAYGVTAIRVKQNKKLAEKQISYLAFYDSLTKLPNRAMLIQKLNQAIEQLRLQGGAQAVLFVDLDDFKLVNDTLGHSTGDELLCQVAERLKNAMLGADIIARQGGDEFIVLLAKYGKQLDMVEFEKNASQVAQIILSELQKPFQIHSQDTYVSASVGISLLPNDSPDAAQLIQYADNAMHRAKELGGNNYQYFSQELSDRQQSKMKLATMLNKAIEKQEFRLHYQPLIDMSDGRMVGVEALIRWEREKGHFISPADFLPVAEDTGLILPIGELVIREACRQLYEWTNKGILLPIAINLSARQMWHGDIAGQILNIINEMKVPKHLLEVEVTESAMIVDPDRMEKTLQHFQDNGIKISLDDFGTGYSSLNRLKHLPFSKLKIDKSFVDGVPFDEDDLAIVTATVQMASSLKMSSLAEGIETIDQYRFLRNLGCHYGQGYYFSKPVPATEIEQLVKQDHRWELQTSSPNTLRVIQSNQGSINSSRNII
ncbi:MAG: EAL domain-containing protein [Psychromonas sp.]